MCRSSVTPPAGDAQSLRAVTGIDVAMKRLWRQLYVFTQQEIEGEHRQLFVMIGRYYAALKSARRRSFRQPLLEELVARVRRHFTHEGELLLEIDHPDAQHHLQEHERILADLSEWMRTGESMIVTRQDFHVLDDVLVHQIREIGSPEFRHPDE